MNVRGDFKCVRQTACWRGSQTEYFTEPRGRKREEYFALGVPKRKCEISLHYPVVTVRAYRLALSSSRTHLKMLWQVHGAETTTEKEHLQKNHTIGNAWESPCYLSSSSHWRSAVSTTQASRSVLSGMGLSYRRQKLSLLMCCELMYAFPYPAVFPQYP